MTALSAERFAGGIFVGPADSPPRWDTVRALFESGSLSEPERRMLLSGRGAGGMAQVGPVICACFGVGLATIRGAIAAGACATVADIGRTLRAGTNCGSGSPATWGNF